MKTFFLLSLLTIFSLLCAAPPKNIIYNEEASSREEVISTGRLTVTSTGIPRKKKRAAQKTAAQRFAQENKVFHWYPSQIQGKLTGGADLINALLSRDESLLVIAERIGGTNKNNSTRLILFDLRQKKITGSHLLTERRISDILFIPGTDDLLAVQNAQEAFGHRDAVVKIDMKTGSVTAVSAPAPGFITSVCTDGKKVWYTVKNDQRVFEHTLANLSEKPLLVNTRIRGPRAALSANFSRLIVYGRGKAEIYAVAGNRPTGLSDEAEFPEDNDPAQAFVLDNAGSLILLNEPGHKAVLFQNGTPRTVAEKTDTAAAYFKNHKAALLSVMKQNAFLYITIPEGETQGKPVQPGKLKPLSRNGNWKILPLSGKAFKAVLIDHRGNIMLLEKTKRRWKKYPLLTVDKTGFR